MIRVVDVVYPRNAGERQRLDAILHQFATTFTGTVGYTEKIAAFLETPDVFPFAVLIRALENGRGTILAFAIIHIYSDLGCAYLDFIASPKRSLPGRGAALYENVREELKARGIKALYMDVPPDELHMVKDPAVLPANRARLRFYETFGAFPITGTAYDGPPPLGQDYDPPFLVYDGLDATTPPKRKDVKKAVEAILVRRYGWERDDPYTRAIIESVKDDPVKLRAPRYVKRGPVEPTSLALDVVVPSRHALHHVQAKGYVERPVRVGAVLEGLKSFDVRQHHVKEFPKKAITEVHDRDFVDYLENMASTLGDKETVYPYVFPLRRPERKPREKWVRAGYYCIDTFTPLSKAAIGAAREAVDCALTASELVEKGKAQVAYALCRPPGHHAERKVFGGFCYFNNAAIVAHRLSKLGKVAFIDVDHHHGNGSQDIFYERDDVLFVSLHGDPRDAYPYFSGFADEKGSGRGLGYNLNIPLPEGTDDEAYLKALKRAVKRIAEHEAKYLVISLGLDIMKGDPTGMFVISTNGMDHIGQALGELKLPTVVVQEGGYRLANLKVGARAFFRGLLGAHQGDSPRKVLG